MKFGTFGAVQTRDNGISSKCSEALSGTSLVSRNIRKVKGTVGRDFLSRFRMNQLQLLNDSSVRWFFGLIKLSRTEREDLKFFQVGILLSEQRAIFC